MIRFFISLILFFSALNAQPILLTDENTSIDSFNVLVYEDKSTKLTIDEIKNIKNFKEVKNNISNGFTDSAFWYKLTIKNESSQAIERYLKMTESIIDKIDFYILSNNIVIKHKKDGVGYFTKDQDNTLQRAYIKLNLQKDETLTVYVKISSFYPMFNSFRIYDKFHLDSFEYDYTTIYAFLIGSLLSLALYNLMIFFYTKDISYMYYVGYSISLICWQTSISGLFPFSSFRSSESYYFVGVSIPALIAFLIYFTISILDIKSLSKKYYSVLNILGIFYIVLSVWSIFDFKHATTVMNATASFILPLLLYIGYKSYKTGNKIAIFYLLAQGCFLSMSTLFSLSTYGFLEYNMFSRHGIMIGSFIEMILFSLALAYRIKLLESEKLVIIQKAKDELELNVKIRTKELEESKKKLEILASRDPLSNLYNRRSLFEISNKLINLAKRESRPLSVLLFDIDKFKNINDTYGHKAGDEVIKAFSEYLQNNRRESDIVARIGGEEFVLLQPAAKLEDAYCIAQKIREEIEKLEVKISNETIMFTVSCGVTSLREEDEKLDELIARADKGLYEAKRSGRNKVIGL